MLMRDNQQITKSWIAGILEGEGSFSYHKNGNIIVRISNSDLGIIEACENFLKENYILFGRYTTKKVPKRNRKRMYDICITRNLSSMNYPKMLYDLIEDQLECRKNQFQRLLDISETTCSPSVDLSWLIGIYEAEGSFVLTHRAENQSNCLITIANTNFDITQKIHMNLEYFKCPHYIYHKAAKNSRKEAEFIMISGMKRCYKFLLLTRDMWISPRNLKRSSSMLDFIKSRFSMPLGSLYTNNQLSLIQSVLDLNR